MCYAQAIPECYASELKVKLKDSENIIDKENYWCRLCLLDEQKKYKDRKSGHISSVKKYGIKKSTSALINHLCKDHGLQPIFNSAGGQFDTNVHAFNDENEVDNQPNSSTSSVNDVDYSVPKK